MLTITRTETIASCYGCPYVRDNTLGYFCLRVKREIFPHHMDKIQDWCPFLKEEENLVTIRLPKDSVLADLLEERGHVEAANRLRNT